MKCSKCGAELSDDTKYCSYCGQKIEVTPPPAVEETEIPPISPDEKVEEEKAGKTKADAPKSFGDKVKDKGIEIWNKLSLYGKVTTVSIAVFVLLCLVALLAGKTAAVIIAIVQITLAVVSVLMHKGVIKLEQRKLWLKWLVLVVAILFTVLNVMSYSWREKKPTSVKTSSSTEQSGADQAEQIEWDNIILSKMLPEPQSDMMEILYNGQDWLSVTVHNISENDFLEYVRWCKEDYGFTVDINSFDEYFYACNQDGYCLTLLYDETSNELSINLDSPTENITETTETDKRTEKNGFDDEKNEVYNLAGYTVEIPNYWKSEKKITDGIQRYAETGGKVAMLQISAQAESDENYPVTFDGLMDDNDNMIKMIESTAFSEVTDYEVIDTGIIKGILYKGTIKDKDNGLSGYGEWFVFASEEDRNWCTLIMSQTDNTDYLYTSDFREMIRSIKVKENKSENPTTSESKSSEITMTMGEEDFKGMNYKEAEEIFREMGFTKFEYRTVDTETESAEDTICYIEITEWFVGDSDFAKGDKFDADSTVTFFSYKYEAPEAPSPVFYSTNDYETAKKGNSGVFSYRDRSSSYDIYWIIDFDEGYVYYFTDGNGDSTCDRLKIDSGTLNDKVIITYHDGSDKWSYSLHFKYVDHPETLIMVDQNGFDYKYSTTDLDDALSLRDTKTIKDY